MNLSPRWVEVFQDAGFESTHWSSVGDGRAADRTIFEWAEANGWIIFTHDLDFARLLALAGTTGPSVLLLRSLEILPSQSAQIVIAVLVQHGEELERGAIVAIDPDSSRVRLLPLA